MFFLVYAVESELSIIPTLYGTFFYFWVTPAFYLILIFLIITQIFFQTTLRDILKMVYSHRDKRNSRKGPMTSEDDSYSPVLVQETRSHQGVPPFIKSHTGYAFS